uniref:Putative HNH homing endonuclease n=1 Tax=Microglena monadina TaxID=47904 RepID=A0A0S2IBQ5_9CHLO|nr:putative HNH homing endonuclease [Microglena monadina]
MKILFHFYMFLFEFESSLFYNKDEIVLTTALLLFLYIVSLFMTKEQDKEGSDRSSSKIFTGNFPSLEEIEEKISNGIDVYLEFINQASQRAEKLLNENPNIYLETHHIIPRFEGGTNDSKNLVRLTFNDHTTAHFIRWIVYKNEKDKTAWKCMSGQSIEIKKEIASLGGKIGGPISQQIQKQNKVGWHNSEGQKERGIKGAKVNKIQGTGGFDPKNLERANKVLNENPELYRPQNLKNLETGRATQKDQGINIGDPVSQRLKSLKRLDFL